MRRKLNLTAIQLEAKLKTLALKLDVARDEETGIDAFARGVMGPGYGRRTIAFDDLGNAVRGYQALSDERGEIARGYLKTAQAGFGRNALRLRKAGASKPA